MFKKNTIVRFEFSTENIAHFLCRINNKNNMSENFEKIPKNILVY